MNLKYTMTSREIAELTGKRHDNVVRDVEAMFNAPNFGAVDFLVRDTEKNFTELNFEPSGLRKDV
ncbi:hypothetical protein E5N72_08650 [Pseudoalteromonas sp. MEBiC 03607]|uniref:Rha family transcriptional regulator n=1 Tax=Pseudoalteromonas sp. MEBiC 03607 TaxID=2563601 RepID=UPI0010935100|nr:Rha family transcriptional regulator [Pseudoalteromonas sp. MEBiC 03607]TGV20139.1 hypothetical protein E5N72_08650 [Pseudoalteromonas sp. MEBiC 03607]